MALPLFDQVRDIKLKFTVETLCIQEAVPLKPFVEQVFGYEFKEEPNYSMLKFLLRCVLLDQDIAPSLKFDWSKFSNRELIVSKNGQF